MPSKDPYESTNYEKHALWWVMKLPILAAALFSSVGTAHAATQWWVLNASMATCQPASQTPLPSPLVTEKYLRQAGNFEQTKVYRDDDNNVTMVTVTNTDDVTVAFFTTKRLCLDGLKSGMDRGIINDPNELR
jgi:hypothetical protein